MGVVSHDADRSRDLRDDLWRSVGELGSHLDPVGEDTSALWPGGSAEYLQVRTEHTGIVTTDGLSDPGQDRPTGLGVELYVEGRELAEAPLPVEARWLQGALEEAVEAVEEIRALAGQAVEPVAATSRLRAPGDAPAPLVIDRRTWIEVNAASMSGMLDPAFEAASRRKTKEPSAAAQAVGSKITGAEAGGMLAFLSTKVLGQYDLAPEGDPALLLVAPNIVATERDIDAVPRDFRLWVCLHEETHRVQFTAVPWLREHLIGQARDLAGALAPDMESLRSRLEQVTAQLPKVLSGEGQGLPVGWRCYRTPTRFMVPSPSQFQPSRGCHQSACPRGRAGARPAG